VYRTILPWQLPLNGSKLPWYLFYNLDRETYDTILW
jgi:hypothetical protein